LKHSARSIVELLRSAILSYSRTIVRFVQQLSVDSLTANCRPNVRDLLQPCGAQGAEHRRPSMDDPPARCYSMK